MRQRSRIPTIWLAYLAALSCSAEHTVLTGSGSSGVSASGASPIGATGGGGVAAMGGGGGTAMGGGGIATGGGGIAMGGGGISAVGGGDGLAAVAGAAAFPAGGTVAVCADDSGCAGTEICEGSVCQPCTYLWLRCDADCPAGWVSSGATRNGCATCDCLECSTHVDCPWGKICVDDGCVDCGEPGTEADCASDCSPRQQPLVVDRNGCPVCECVANSDCHANEQCPPGEICYAGRQCFCPDGAFAAECCEGNLCGLPGCAPTEYLPCSVVGCADGWTCVSACPELSCWCDGNAWQCSETCYEAYCQPL